MGQKADKLRHAMAEECGCAICEARLRGLTVKQALAERARWEQEQMRNHGWFIDLVSGDDETGELADAHTHGLPQSFGHSDLQLVLPLPLTSRTVGRILTNLVNLIKSGTKLEAGSKYSEVIENYQVLMLEAVEGGRPVLRVILPDKYGCLDRDQIRHPFQQQWPGDEQS